MKSVSRILSLLLLAALPFTLFSQGMTIVAAYMKVAPARESDYLQVENEWKKIHQKAIEEGVYNGWQLYRKLHAGDHDPYQYITLQWYNNYEQTFGENAPENWQEGIYSDEEWTALMVKTLASRVRAYESVHHLVTMSDTVKPIKYLVIGEMKVKPGMQEDYVNMEKEVAKTYMDEYIKRDMLSYWGIWSIWPYNEGQPRYHAVQGFRDAAQLAAGTEMLPPSEVGLDYTMEEVMELMQKTREIVAVEVWELVDQVWPEAQE